MTGAVIGLAVGGLDPSGGAGVIVDLLTMSAFGLRPQAVLTASTVQSIHSLRSFLSVDRKHLYDQLRMLFESMPPSVVKIGMLADEPAADALADALRELGKGIPVVLDTPFVSSSGHPLITDAGLRVMIKRILPLATVVTPNVMEAERLSGLKILTAADAAVASEKIFALGAGAVVVKGGHLCGEPADHLFDGRRHHVIEGSRIVANVRGTGCMFASALASGLALGLDVLSAAKEAKAFVTAVLRGAGEGSEDEMQLGAIPAPGAWEIRKN